MVASMKESSNIIESKVMATSSGLMERNTKDFRRTTKCTEKGISFGLMAENMKDSM